jgi:uncharacterized repeat protein (TIGR01451 family)
MIRPDPIFFLALVLSVPLLPTVAFSQTITDFEPTFGKPGTQVVITGPDFSGVTDVKFNGRSATSWFLVAQPPTQITAFVPAGATTGPISVTTSLSTLSSMTDFTVIGDEPYITGFSPPTGSPGNIIIIVGANFTPASAVKFNGVLAPFFYAISDAQIQATVPLDVTTGPVTVTSPFGTGSSITNFYVPPIITGFAPGFGKPGDSITISGFNFIDARGVEFNGQLAAFFQVLSNTELLATVPTDALTGLITVQTPIGGVDSSTNFIVAPRISGFSPATGAPGTNVTVTGANLTGATAVKFNGTNAVSFSVTDQAQLSAKVPPGATTGPLSVTTPAGTATSLTYFFLAPKITGFSPSDGEAGAPVTITGVNFTGATAVRFGSATAVFEVSAPTQISANVPSNAMTGPISVAAPAGTATTSSNFVVFTTADLAVSQTAAPDPVTVGSLLTYTITVTNRGPKGAANVLLTDTLPAGVQFVSAEPSQGSWSHIGGNVICSVGLLADAAAATVTILVTPAAAGSITNQVTVTTATLDSDISNNSSSRTTTVLPPPGLSSTFVPALNNVIIAWPRSASNFVLQVTGDLRPRISWANVTNAPVVVGETNRLTVDSRQGNQFFRLKQP